MWVTVKSAAVWGYRPARPLLPPLGPAMASHTACQPYKALLVSAITVLAAVASVPNLFANPTQELYVKGVKPLLAEKCISCHGPLDQQAGLRLDAGDLIHRGGDSGEIINANEPDQSLLLARVCSVDAGERMPPVDEGTPLNEEEIELVRRWIAAGAPYPSDEFFLTEPKDHWAFQPPTRPRIPTPSQSAAKSSDNRLNPIDAFLDAQREHAGIGKVGRTDDETLLRRLTLSLTGLPPTPLQRQTFLSERAQSPSSPQMLIRFVDSLLADPAYAERWARHWMDVWRYSDWDGYKNELRGSQRHIWHWRDWIIESLATDKPYHVMITQMLAADELMPLDEDALRATGYLARNYHSSNRNIWLDATVEHTAKAFLGLTIDCAKCHDHKYDPISQEEYYQFRAIFEPHRTRTNFVAGQPDRMLAGIPRVFDADLEAKTEFLIAGDEKRPDPTREIKPQPPRIVGLPMLIESVQLPLLARIPQLKPEVRQTLIEAENQKVTSAKTALQQAEGTGDASAIELAQAKLQVACAAQASLVARLTADAAKYTGDEAAYPQLAAEAARLQKMHALVTTELDVITKRQTLAAANARDDDGADEKQKRITAATEALTKAEQQRDTAADALATPGDQYDSAVEVYPETSTGRRTALARWITDERNPLTARVAVNHIWMRHFGRPLVANVFDFGLRSPRPRQQELLDYLATELIDSGWHLKHIHRLIVTSDAFAMASYADQNIEAQCRAIDPDNELYWRFEPLRLEGEAIRDSLLAVADELDRDLGGSDIDHQLGEQVHRRSLYFRHAYEKQMTMLTTFDAASPNECYRRDSSIIPQQALVLANSELSRKMSQQLAEKLSATLDKSLANQEATLQFITLAFQHVLGRNPSATETVVCEQFFDSLQTLNSNATPTAGEAAAHRLSQLRTSLVHVLINHNDFVTIR